MPRIDGGQLAHHDSGPRTPVNVAMSLTMLAVLYHPIALLLLLVVAAIGWSRVVLDDHSRGQVIAGALCRFAASAAVFPLA